MSRAVIDDDEFDHLFAFRLDELLQTILLPRDEEHVGEEDQMIRLHLWPLRDRLSTA